jgi:hypothetical protein
LDCFLKSGIQTSVSIFSYFKKIEVFVCLFLISWAH